jgi:hypothetical protein
VGGKQRKARRRDRILRGLVARLALAHPSAARAGLADVDRTASVAIEGVAVRTTPRTPRRVRKFGHAATVHATPGNMSGGTLEPAGASGMSGLEEVSGTVETHEGRAERIDGRPGRGAASGGRVAWT